MSHRFQSWVLRHKGVFALLVMGGAGLGIWGYRDWRGQDGQTRYLLAPVARGTVVATVLGSGQVIASDQVEIMPSIAGEVARVTVKAGQTVAAGDVVAQLDAREAKKAARDAAANLAAAQLALEKLRRPVDPLEVLQAENALQNARDAAAKIAVTQPTEWQAALDDKRRADNALSQSFIDALNAVANAYLDLPSVITTVHEILYGTTVAASESLSTQNNLAALLGVTAAADQAAMQQLQNVAERDYGAARSAYDVSFASYQTITRSADPATVEALLNDTVTAITAIAQAAKSESNYLDAWIDYRAQRNRRVFAQVISHQTELSSAIGQVNGHLTATTAIQQALRDGREARANAERKLDNLEQTQPLDRAAAAAAVREREASLAKLKAGVDPVDVQLQELTVRQRQNAVADAQETLVEATVRTPLAGVVAEVGVKSAEAVTPSTVVATVIADRRVAEITLNEVDVAKVAAGQKVTLRVDAVPETELTGVVADVDILGTVAQGVVSYAVRIAFDTNDERVKPGMSVSATVITEVKPDVLTVPNAAVKTQGNLSYVEVADGNAAVGGPAGRAAGVALAKPPRRQPVETGLANDEVTEIIDGVSEDETVVTGIVSPSRASNRPANQPPAMRIPGLPGGGGLRGGFR